MSDEDDEGIPGSQGRTKSGRVSFKKNPLSAMYGSKSRDADNDKLLLGQKMPLGKAMGILAVVMCGPDLPTEKFRHGERVAIWQSAAKYALNEESIKTVLEWPNKEELVVYMLGLLTTATFSTRSLYTITRDYAQTFVFAPSRLNADIQRHLGLGPTQRILDQ